MEVAGVGAGPSFAVSVFGPWSSRRRLRRVRRHFYVHVHDAGACGGSEEIRVRCTVSYCCSWLLLCFVVVLRASCDHTAVMSTVADADVGSVRCAEVTEAAHEAASHWRVYLLPMLFATLPLGAYFGVELYEGRHSDDFTAQVSVFCSWEAVGTSCSFSFVPNYISVPAEHLLHVFRHATGCALDAHSSQRILGCQGAVQGWRKMRVPDACMNCLLCCVSALATVCWGRLLCVCARTGMVSLRIFYARCLRVYLLCRGNEGKVTRVIYGLNTSSLVRWKA